MDRAQMPQHRSSPSEHVWNTSAVEPPLATMTAHSSPVLANQSPVQHDHHRPVSHSRIYYPPVHSVRRPSPVHNGYIRRQSETQRTDTTRVQSSISSAESGSSAMTAVKPHHSPKTYWHASTMEQGLVNEVSEKSAEGWHSPATRYSPTLPHREMVEDNSAVLRYIQEQRKLEDEDEESDHAMWILFWISCLDPIHSLISAIYTLLVVLTLTLVSPLRLCRKQSSLGDQIIRVLAPMFRNHLEMMYAPSIEDAFSFQFKAYRLVIVHLTAPVLSLGVMIAGWVTAAFWLFSRMMGNPDGTERRDDGRDTVIQVRDWWEKFLLHALEQ